MLGGSHSIPYGKDEPRKTPYFGFGDRTNACQVMMEQCSDIKLTESEHLHTHRRVFHKNALEVIRILHIACGALGMHCVSNQVG